MTVQRQKAVIVLVLTMAAFAGAQAWRPTAHLADSRTKVDLETMFPKAFGGWVVDEKMPVQLVSPDTLELLSQIYNQTLSRTYVNPIGERVMLSVAYGGDQSDGTKAHRPDVCYPAQGFEILATKDDHITLGTEKMRVRRMVARLGGRTEPITYWLTVGDRVVLTGTEAKLAQLSYSMRGVVPDGMLVRVSSIDSDVPRAYGKQEAFLVKFIRAIRADLQPQVVGMALE